MKRYLLLMLILFAFISSCKENPVDITYGTIKGFVYDKATNLPIEEAFITTMPPSTTIKSDKDGKFEIPNLSTNYYKIFADKDGYNKTSIDIEVKEGKSTSCIIPMTKGIVDTTVIGPGIPFNPNPRPNSIIKNANVNLTWMCNNPTNEVLKFSVYFGTDPSNLTPVASNINQFNFNITNLVNTTKYYWYVTATNSKGLTSRSEIWSFTYNTDANYSVPNDYYTYIPFDGDFKDYSPNQWLTSSRNNQYIADRFGNPNKAIKMGSMGNVIIEDVNASNYSNLDLSISVWLKPNKECHVPTFGTHIGIVTDYLNRVYMGITYLNEPEVWTRGDAWVGVLGELPNNIWSNLIIVFKRDTKRCDIYINGNLAATGILPDIHTDQLTKLQIGGRDQYGDQYCGGMDDLRIYRRALTNSEILGLAQ